MTLNLTILIVLLTSVAANKTSHSLNATLKTFDPRLLNSTADRDIAMQNVPLIRLTRHLLSPERYDVRVRPILDHKKSLKVHISISLYQIIEVDEPSQNIKLNVWMIQKWKDESTLRVPPSAGSVSDKRQSFQMIDVTSPNSPNTARSRAPSLAPSTAKATMWEGTMSALAGTNTQLRRTSNVFNKEVDEMRRKRQCSLEWEFLATVLDRFLLIVFVGAVLIVTSGLILVGRMAQYSYDHPDDQFFHV
ncbi:Protein CBG24089 [Caenorhabditis briggsae]|uniref:Protein CBG24089 n=1 Tax=Caenorhabditis briggsae TaxID=6238 RepID=A8WJY6_CAEBR|nr:Protein CBG24089 [Caenorhabditis briggsae]CAP20779.2 Protein CBG24089 [Caenorhabditis briggsae]